MSRTGGAGQRTEDRSENTTGNVTGSRKGDMGRDMRVQGGAGQNRGEK